MEKLVEYIENNFGGSRKAFAEHADLPEMTVSRLCAGEIPNKKAKRKSAIMAASRATNFALTPNDFYGVPEDLN